MKSQPILTFIILLILLFALFHPSISSNTPSWPPPIQFLESPPKSLNPSQFTELTGSHPLITSAFISTTKAIQGQPITISYTIDTSSAPRTEDSNLVISFWKDYDGTQKSLTLAGIVTKDRKSSSFTNQEAQYIELMVPHYLDIDVTNYWILISTAKPNESPVPNPFVKRYLHISELSYGLKTSFEIIPAAKSTQLAEPPKKPKLFKKVKEEVKRRIKKESSSDSLPHPTQSTAKNQKLPIDLFTEVLSQIGDARKMCRICLLTSPKFLERCNSILNQLHKMTTSEFCAFEPRLEFLESVALSYDSLLDPVTLSPLHAVILPLQNGYTTYILQRVIAVVEEMRKTYGDKYHPKGAAGRDRFDVEKGTYEGRELTLVELRGWVDDVSGELGLKALMPGRRAMRKEGRVSRDVV